LNSLAIPQLTIGFIGAGRCGTALAKSLSEVGYTVNAIASRSEKSNRSFADLVPDAKPTTPTQVVATCDLVFITTPDGAIKKVVEQLQWRKGQYVVYSSGALELSNLNSVLEFGALRGCFHPLQSFTYSPHSDLFNGISIGVEADPDLDKLLEQMASRLGSTTVRLEGVNRARYHAAAIFANNYVVALHSAAARIWESAGLPSDSAQQALTPLTTSAVEYLKRLPQHQTLTGPIARGDTATIEKQLAALAATPDLEKLYRELGKELLNLELGHDDATKILLDKLLKNK